MTERNLGAVVIHHGNPSATVAFVKGTLAAGPGVGLIVVNNGPDSDAVLRASLPAAVDVLGKGTNRGYAAAANLGIEWSLEHGIDDVVILANDGLVPPGALHELQLAAEVSGATVVGPLVLYEGSDVIWADGLDFNRTWGVARNARKGAPRHAAGGSRFVSHLPGHCILLRGCASRRWLRFDEEFFMYYEDVALCTAVAANGEKVMLTDQTVVYHRKPGLAGYRFKRTQQRHMARSGLIFWAKYVRGWRRVSHLFGFLALTLYRLFRSDGISTVWAGLQGLGSGSAAAIRILRGRAGVPGALR